MSKKNIQKQKRGWYEVLFRLDESAAPKNMVEVRLKDYEIVAGPLPFMEFDKVFDVVELFSRENGLARRPLREFDVVSLFSIDPMASNTFVLVRAASLAQFGHAGCSYIVSEEADLMLVPTRSKGRFAPQYKSLVK